MNALKRVVSFWSPLLPSGTTGQQGNTLPLRLDSGDRLNALYNRASPVFFHSSVEGVTIFTEESPNVISHEVGHAVFDAVRPQLWDARGGTRGSTPPGLRAPGRAARAGGDGSRPWLGRSAPPVRAPTE